LVRAKQLAALVVKRPWWQTLPEQSVGRFVPLPSPLGATAVLALTFLSVLWNIRRYVPERRMTPILLEDNAAPPAAPAVSAFDQVATLGSFRSGKMSARRRSVGATEPVDANGPVAEPRACGRPGPRVGDGGPDWRRA